MARGKYDQFWEDRSELLAAAMKLTVETGNEVRFIFPSIEGRGQRKNWFGAVVLSEGNIVKGGEMAHMNSLGKILAPDTAEYHGIRFRFSMNNRFELMIKLDPPPIQKSAVQPDKIDAGTEIHLPEDCRDLHKYVWNLPRYGHTADWKKLPDNGIYFLFETGEKAHNGDRIVRVGTHRADGRLAKRIWAHYYGRRDNSIFKHHLGKALSLKLRIKVSEEDISNYMCENFSFSVLAEKGGKSQRLALERKAIETVSSCLCHQSSPHWLGHHSPEEKIRVSGLWNVQGVKLPKRQPQIKQTDPVLVLIPCSARKTKNPEELFSPDQISSVFNLLSGDGREKLKLSREIVAPLSDIDWNSEENAALEVYDGFLYQVVGFKSTVVKAVEQDLCKIGILSGAYGLVLPNEEIHLYECPMPKTYNCWKNILPKIIRDFAQTNRIQRVYGFFSRTTKYAKVFRNLKEYRGEFSDVRQYYPDWNGKGGAMRGVPDFLGKVAKHFIHSGCDPDSLKGFTAEGMPIDCEKLC